MSLNLANGANYLKAQSTSALVNNDGKPFTLMMWLRPFANHTTNWQPICSTYDIGKDTGSAWELDYSPGNSTNTVDLTWSSAASGAAPVYQGANGANSNTKVIPLNLWTHFAIRFNISNVAAGATSCLYDLWYNAINIGTSGSNTNLQSGQARQLLIGQSADNPNLAFPGSIAFFKMFRGTLSPRDIRRCMMYGNTPPDLINQLIVDLPLTKNPGATPWEVDISHNRLGGGFVSVGTTAWSFDPPVVKAYTAQDPYPSPFMWGTAAAGNTSYTLTAAAGTFTETGEAATLNVAVVAGVGTFTETGVAATLNVSVVAGAGSFTETGEAATGKIVRTTSTGTFTETGVAATLNVAVVAGAGSFTETGKAATLNVAVVASTGTFAETGVAATLNVAVVAGAGSFTETGVAATLNVAVVAGAGSFTETGEAATGKIVRTTSTGTFTETGVAATLNVAVVTSAGTFAETGVAATLNVAVVAGVGTFTETGVNATQNVAMTAGTGSFAETGETATFTTGLIAGVGAFVLAGEIATLIYHTGGLRPSRCGTWYVQPRLRTWPVPPRGVRRMPGR